MTTIPARFDERPDPDGHSEWIAHAPTMKKVPNAPGYPQPVPKPPGNVKLYTVKSTATMGKGVFVTRDIRMGEMIFAERPLLVVPSSMTVSGIEVNNDSHKNRVDFTKIILSQQEKQLEAAVARMDPDRRAKLMALTNSCTGSGDGGGPINGIVSTNAYAVMNLWDVDPGEGIPSELCYYGAVCDVGSRINHSCLPNVDHGFNLSSFSMLYFAMRDIKAGEQLFYSYCPGERSASERKALLETSYGIEQCICAACINATPETDALRKTFHARVQEYSTTCAALLRLPKFPVEFLDDLLRYQRAVFEEGLDWSEKYSTALLPTLIAAYRRASRLNDPEAAKVVQDMVRLTALLKYRKTVESSQL
ncbi:hypothetical protein M413DRAFT_75533 [Hebeloma cylindrosporum]|uniref:SET domain-containing protein n=1 Tax=Hebeloma cylindrosporum TaxID=76867 RepID=A0A0C3C5I8_HEBCY|nr:hypothetical protein M413DRAFT_75533 [Hebeloma cylindrosporum h7]